MPESSRILISRETTTLLPEPIKGKADWRKYKAFRLSNGVTCLVINDKESKTTAMSCIVEVGASSDPRELSGLAHFCEHMCFLGSEKYPGENDYKRYLASHGGRSNASTSMHLTNYKFEVLADHAEKAVDIFSNFFVAPLFTSSGTEREVQAVNSENSKNLTAESRRRLQILKDLADPDHYYSKFSTGNAETLPTDDPEKLQWVREALLAFHRKHYRPEKMTVVIAGPQSIETLEEWVGDRYSQISTTSTSSTTTSSTSTSSTSTSSTSSKDITATTMRSQVEKLVATAAEDAPPYAFEEAAPSFNPAFKSSLLQRDSNSNSNDSPSWPVLLTTKPLRSMRKLALMFPIPSDRKTPDRAPSAMLSHLLGHEGAGSAFATLQNNGMLSSLSAGPRTSAPDFTLFQVDMGLTEKGEEHWEEVVNLIFAYCRLLQEKATTGKDSVDELKRIWKEMCELDKIFFHQTSPGGTYGYAPNLGDRVVSYGTEACLSAGSMLNENEDTFPLQEFIKLTKLLTPMNCIIERCSEGAYETMEQKDKDKEFADDAEGCFGLKKEKWYGVEYYLSPVEKKHVSAWNGFGEQLSVSDDGPAPAAADAAVGKGKGKELLSLPVPNRYIPRTLELCPDLPEDARKGQRIEKAIDPPSLLVNEENWKLFHRLDDRYALPKSSLHFLIRNMSLQNIKNNENINSNDDDDDDDEWVYDSRSSLLSSFLAAIFNEAMAQETYDADLAGLHWSLSIGSTGIKLTCFGFSDRLPDLALKVLGDFLSGEFLSDEKFFTSSRDRTIRGLRTYFESRRADSHAMYYRDSLMGSKGQGMNEALEIALAAKFEDVVKHHQTILQDNQRSVQCLFSGNVSSKEATEFFSGAKSKIIAAYEVQKQQESESSDVTETETETIIDPGIIERQLQQGQEVELHFSSQNAEEENGAVLCTYQSSIPSFKGEILSHPLGLHSSSAIRLLCHILREPLFDSLRTKQQLGYIVSSYYEIGISSQSNEKLGRRVPLTTPVDFITINVLSQKMAPPDIADRIDEFMQVFRTSLEGMPESEIRDHADALATNLLKPTQKLQSEASLQYSRIQRYGPEVFHRAKYPPLDDGSGSGRGRGGGGGDTKDPQATNAGSNATNDADEIPWNTTQALASTIRGLSREELLKTFDRMTHPSTRSRVVSCVYGKKFPLKSSGGGGGDTSSTSTKMGTTIVTSKVPPAPHHPSSSSSAATTSFFSSLLQRGQQRFVHHPKSIVTTTKIVNSFPDLLKFRTTLPNFSSSGVAEGTNAKNANANVNANSFSILRQRHRGVLMVGLGVLGATILGLAVANHRSTSSSSSSSSKQPRTKLNE